MIHVPLETAKHFYNLKMISPPTFFHKAVEVNFVKAGNGTVATWNRKRAEFHELLGHVHLSKMCGWPKGNEIGAFTTSLWS